MSTWPFVKSERICLKNHPELPESWVAERIAEDPSILGLGDFRCCGQSGKAVLLESNSANCRYAVLVQSGAVDEVQFVEALEIWDRESKREPDRELRAVLVAETIGARFVNLIPVVAAAVPLGLLQVQAMRVGAQMTLIFAPIAGIPAPAGVLPAPVEPAAAPAGKAQAAAEPRPAEFFSIAPILAPPANRAYWENRARPGVEIADQLLSAIQATDPAIELDYQREFIGLAKHGEPLPFARFTPEPGGLLLGLELEPNSLIELSIAQAGLERLNSEGSNGYRIWVNSRDIEAQREPVTRLMQLAYEESLD